MTFRTADPDEAEIVVRFWHESGASMSPNDSAERLQLLMSNPMAAVVLAFEGTQLVGTLIGAFDGWRGNMYRLVVHPAHRRRGIARQLVRHVEDLFRRWGVRRITVLIEKDRPWAVAFWTAAGYPVDDHIVRHVGTLE